MKTNQNGTARFKKTPPFADKNSRGPVDRPAGGTHGWTVMKSDHRSGESEIGPEHPASTDAPCPDAEKQKLESRNRKGDKLPPLPDPSEAPPVHTLASLRARLIFFFRHNKNGRGHFSDTPTLPHSSAPLPEALDPQLSTLNQLDWSLLLKQTKWFARRQMKRYFWRGEEKGGLLPDGYEPRSIAAEAVAEFLNELSTFNPQLANLNQEQVRRGLRRRAHHLIDRLRHRTENRLFRNEEDLAPFMTDDGETIVIWELIPAPDATPLEELLYKEECAEVEKLKDEFIVFLGKDRLLKNVFACQWAGEFKPKAIARALKLPVRAIQHLQRRLKRRGTVFFHLKFPGKIRIRSNYCWF